MPPCEWLLESVQSPRDFAEGAPIIESDKIPKKMVDVRVVKVKGDVEMTPCGLTPIRNCGGSC